MAVIVKVNLAGMEQVVAAIKAGGRTPEIRAMFRTQGLIYGNDMTRRFTTFSRGGGTWAPKARSTLVSQANKRDRKTAAYKKLGARLARGEITTGQYNRARTKILTQTRAARRKNARDRSQGILGAAGRGILIDKGTLRRALLSSMDRQNVPAGLVFKFPAQVHDRGLTVRKLAAIHHFGTRHIPARPILVDPSADAVRQFENTGRNAVRDIAARSRVR